MGETIVKRYLLSALTLSLLAGLSQAGAPAPGANATTATTATTAVKPVTPALTSGIAIEYIEPAVRVQDDFFTHLNGKWLKTTEIPADKASWGAFAKLHDDTQPQLRAIIDNAARSVNQAAGTDAQRIGDLYASYMDEQKADVLGLAPLAGELARINALKNKAELPAILARLGQLGVGVPYDFAIHQD
ncbi:MAG: M13 family peptidase, partial [Massilia sp.]|nr:M13 family peptidase [Massilia sp.]